MCCLYSLEGSDQYSVIFIYFTHIFPYPPLSSNPPLDVKYEKAVALVYSGVTRLDSHHLGSSIENAREEAILETEDLGHSAAWETVNNAAGEMEEFQLKIRRYGILNRLSLSF